MAKNSTRRVVLAVLLSVPWTVAEFPVAVALKTGKSW